MSKKQDRQGVRTAADLERKYNLGQSVSQAYVQSTVRTSIEASENEVKRYVDSKVDYVDEELEQVLSEVPQIINTALEEAKASGEFDGPPGPEGPEGPKGEDGTGVTILGSYNSADELIAAHPTGKTGDSYLVNGSLYVWSDTAGTWQDVGNIKGPKGDQGVRGEPGKDGYTPIKGVDYFDGLPGKDGKDGYTPIKGVDYFDGLPGKDGYTPIKGVDYFDGLPGNDGEPGKAGADGYTPIKGVDYFDGLPGKDGEPGKAGADGYTPVKGKDYFDGLPGKDGEPGKDGTSVTVSSVSESTADGGSNVVTFSDGKTLTVKNGSKGSAGETGKDGISATHSWNGTVLTVTSASGTSSADLKGVQGEMGETPDVWILEGGITSAVNGSVTVSLYKNGVLYTGSAYLVNHVSSAGGAWREHGGSKGSFTGTKTWSFGGSDSGIAWRCFAYSDSTKAELLASCSVCAGITGPQGIQGERGDTGSIFVTVEADSLDTEAIRSDKTFSEIEESILAGIDVKVKLISNESYNIYLQMTAHIPGSEVDFCGYYNGNPLVLQLFADE